MIDLNAIAEFVDDASRYAKAIPQLSESGKDLTLEQAYEVQRLSVQRRYDRGQVQVGVKMGFTSGLHVRLEAQNMGSVSFSVK